MTTWLTTLSKAACLSLIQGETDAVVTTIYKTIATVAWTLIAAHDTINIRNEVGVTVKAIIARQRKRVSISSSGKPIGKIIITAGIIDTKSLAVMSCV